MADQDKTEKATPKRMQEARKKGQTARSQDLSVAIILFGMVVVLYVSRQTFLGALTRYLTGYFSSVGSAAMRGTSPVALLTGTVSIMSGLLVPFLLAGVILALAVNLLQVGFVFNLEGLAPQFKKLNPAEGIKRLFSSRGLIEVLKSFLKVIILGLVAYVVIRGRFGSLLDTLQDNPVAIFNTAADLVWRIFLYGCLAYLAIAVADYRYQRYMMDKSLRMSKQEVKDEFRQYEGDPVIRGKQRARRRQFLRNLIRKNVPQATVVITNPVHLAVALTYELGGSGAPRVVAKGAGEVARHIREVATEAGVPVVENVSVARILFRYVDVGAEIPGQLYQAVAQILAVVYKSQAKKAG